MTNLTMPPARDFGWELKPTRSSHFEIHQRENGQFAVVLNHALLRGVTSEMLYWWFMNFPNLSVRLVDVPGYEGQHVPGYYLWHPSDHHSARLSGRLNADGSPRVGASIHIREAMQYDKFGWKYPVDSQLKIFYVGADGWAMGKALPVIGPIMMLRIHYKDVVENGRCVGAHYHYEIVVGASGNNFLIRQFNKRLSSKFGPEFFEAWHRHNVIEVGVFENFLPPLFAQRNNLSTLHYSRDMDPKPPSPSEQTGRDHDLFQHRIAGYKTSADPFAYQQYDASSFL